MRHSLGGSNAAVAPADRLRSNSNRRGYAMCMEYVCMLLVPCCMLHRSTSRELCAVCGMLFVFVCVAVQFRSARAVLCTDHSVRGREAHMRLTCTAWG
jgi:hypothetical protein